ncbi:AAA family ATPase [uncultured Hymenobacter sp.]|uniref:AAA family ATPase n=1 Tax=uncultured Hymenobacter sp. TaxID=170016 RepID=UPI0035CC6998
MATKRTSAAPTPPPVPARPPYMLIEQIQVKGYKSLVDATLHVRPLTLLAGTNSSGKSSIMQPLLLIKQTMEAPYQPAGALVLSGAHVQAETAGELISKIMNSNDSFSFRVSGVMSSPNMYPPSKDYLNFLEVTYGREADNFSIVNQDVAFQSHRFTISPNLDWNNIKNQFSGRLYKSLFRDEKRTGYTRRRNGFIELVFTEPDGKISGGVEFGFQVENSLAMLFHIPGLRGAPKRSYSTTFFVSQIKGTFDLYAAGTISQWQQQQNTEALEKLNDYLRRLGLTNSVEAKVKNANEVELSVNRLPTSSKAKPRKSDLVNIADVGIGVSQVLPILVALIAAQEGQLVYIEQPELHLHPRAQVVMAELLADAANRGVRVIVETHSSLLLLTVQTLIAEDKIKNTDVALHWFARDAKGATQVTYVQPDEDGAYGEWPEDFGDVEMKAQDAYLTAVGLRKFGKAAPANS